MLKALRIKIVEKIVEINEKFVFERRLHKFYKTTFNNKINCVIDVGSNKGQTIDFFLKINPGCRIFGFEPNPKLFKKLTDKYSGNKNVKLFKHGISDSDGTKTFHENIFDSTSSFEDLNLNSAYLKKKSSILGVKPENIIKSSYKVDIITLSNFIKNNITEDIDVIKIDTEGHEHACLLGLFKQKFNINIKYLQLENHNDDMYTNRIPFEETKKYLKENNYKLYCKIKHGFGNIEEVIFKHKTI